MRLPHAMVLGSTLRPQGFGAEFIEDATCARGAALEAVGKLVADMHSTENLGIFWEEWPWTGITHADCPSNGCTVFTVSISVLISHLNDNHRWSRPEIAAWVRTVEPDELPQLVEAVEELVEV